MFNTKWKKNQSGERKVTGQATVVAHCAQKVGGRPPTLSNRLRRQCRGQTDGSPTGSLLRTTLMFLCHPLTPFQSIFLNFWVCLVVFLPSVVTHFQLTSIWQPANPGSVSVNERNAKHCNHHYFSTSVTSSAAAPSGDSSNKNQIPLC